MAENLKALRRRIRTVTSTEQITRAMETVSAAKLRRNQERLVAARPYAHALRELVGHLAADESARQHPFFETREVRHRTLVLVTADRGLCGSFNTNLIKATEEVIAGAPPDRVSLVCIGKKGRDYFRRRPYPLLYEALQPGGVASLDAAREAARLCCERYSAGETDRVDLVFAHFASLSSFPVVRRPYLPLAAEALIEAPAGEPSAFRAEYLFEPDAAGLFAALLPRYLQSQLFLALSESLTSEFCARRLAMNNATKNCRELIETLTLRLNKARQASITRELLDIIGGAEAIAG